MYVVESELRVNISSVTPASNGLYKAGSPVSLSCNTEGGTLPLSYQWNSTCDGLCFTHEMTSQTVGLSALHSKDTANYTCYVEDYTGHSGSDMIQIVVTG